MVRRARVFLPLLASVVLVATACGGETIPPAPGPAHRPPAVTATPEPEPTPTASATPDATPVAKPASSPSPTPPSAVTATRTPEPTSAPTAAPPAIEYTPITRGEPRPLPPDVALYYYLALPCTLCAPLPYDLRRVVFDEVVGELREDRPLSFFDGVIDFFDHSSLDYGTQKVTSFGASSSGRTLAVTLCHVGRCQVEPVGGVYPTLDWELRLWVSDDSGRTWEDRGLLLPETVIGDVTDSDVLLRTWNFWRYADRKYTDAELERMRGLLEPLGLDALEGREHWLRWVVSGDEPAPVTPEATPVGLGWVDWRRLAPLPSGSIAWSAVAEGVYLLAITSAEGAVEKMFGSAEPLWEHRAWWFRSGEDLEIPRYLLVPRIWAWRGGGVRFEPFWPDSEGTALVSASGVRLPRPLDFFVAASLPDGSILWRSHSTSADRGAMGPDQFLRLDDQGARLGAYSWGDKEPRVVLDHLEGHLFVGFLGTYTCGVATRPVLVDFGSRTVHTIPGLDARTSFVPYAARPAPD